MHVQLTGGIKPSFYAAPPLRPQRKQGWA